LSDPANPDVGSANGTSELERLSEQSLVVTRYAVLLPIVLLLLSALGSFIYGAVFFVDAIRHIASHAFPIGVNLGYFITIVDLFLVGATLFIAAIGLYELFFPRRRSSSNSDDSTWLPSWLVMRDIDDLKARVIAMLVLVAAATFVEVEVDFRQGPGILYLGAGVALTVAALTFFLWFGRGGRRP
jgi:uncharacterized membrane protein YqhA